MIREYNREDDCRTAPLDKTSTFPTRSRRPRACRRGIKSAPCRWAVFSASTPDTGWASGSTVGRAPSSRGQLFRSTSPARLQSGCAAVLSRWSPHAHARLVLIVGFLGGYTTFSSYSFESLTLWERGKRRALRGIRGRQRRCGSYRRRSGNGVGSRPHRRSIMKLSLPRATSRRSVLRFLSLASAVSACEPAWFAGSS